MKVLVFIGLADIQEQIAFFIMLLDELTELLWCQIFDCDVWTSWVYYVKCYFVPARAPAEPRPRAP
jgi:hypothetical protein